MFLSLSLSLFVRIAVGDYLIQNFKILTYCKSGFKKYIFCHLSASSSEQLKSNPWKSNENSFPISLAFTHLSLFGKWWALFFWVFVDFHSVWAYHYENINTSYVETVSAVREGCQMSVEASQHIYRTIVDSFLLLQNSSSD